MSAKSLICSATNLLKVLLVLSCITLSTTRSADGLARIEKLLGTSASSSSLTSPGLAGSDLTAEKRTIFDPACKGIFDRGLIRKLEKVCDDCYNVYRKPYVGVECRTNCYGNLIFRQCLDDLLMMDVVDEYVNMVQVIGK